MFRCLQICGDSKYGGGTYLILSWCRFLLEKGCDVTVLSTDRSTIAELIKIPGIRLISSVFIPREIAIMKDIKAIWQLLNFVKQNNYQIVHTHSSTPGFVGRIASWLGRVPVRLHTAHGWPVNEYLNTIARFLFKSGEYLAGLVSTRIICVSHATAYFGKKFHITPKHKLITICNGIDPKPFIAAIQGNIRAYIRRELRVTPDCVMIGNTSRLAAQKDNATLILSIPFLKKLIPGKKFLLVLAGDGPESSKLKELTNSLGISEYVVFLGFYRDIPALLSAIDVFVSPSLWEGLSISLLEAMASGLPIVTTNILPNAELIEHEKTGLLVPPKSPELVAKAIARFVHEPDLAQNCAKSARLRVMEQYTIERMFNDTWDLYVSLIAEKKFSKTAVLGQIH